MISNCVDITTVNTVRNINMKHYPFPLRTETAKNVQNFYCYSIVYYDVPHRKARDGKTPGAINIVMNFTSSFATARFWEVRVSQIPFSQRAPAGCLQYFFGTEGIIEVNERFSSTLFSKYLLFSSNAFQHFWFQICLLKKKYLLSNLIFIFLI